jgi:hypothetical protein
VLGFELGTLGTGGKRAINSALSPHCHVKKLGPCVFYFCRLKVSVEKVPNLNVEWSSVVRRPDQTDKEIFQKKTNQKKDEKQTNISVKHISPDKKMLVKDIRGMRYFIHLHSLLLNVKLFLMDLTNSIHNKCIFVSK